LDRSALDENSFLLNYLSEISAAAERTAHFESTKRGTMRRAVRLAALLLALFTAHASLYRSQVGIAGGYQCTGSAAVASRPRPLSLCLRGGGFSAVVPINRLLGKAKKKNGKAAKKQTGNRVVGLEQKDAALIDFIKSAEDDSASAKCVAELVHDGARVGVQDPSSVCDYTALHLAASRGLTQTVQTLVRNGAIVDTPAKHGQTPLSLAAARGFNDTVACLLALGASVLHKDMLGWTPLHQAAYYGSEAVVVQLLQAGADASAKAKDGTTAEALAQKNPLTSPATAIAIADALSLATLSAMGRDVQQRIGERGCGAEGGCTGTRVSVGEGAAGEGGGRARADGDASEMSADPANNLEALKLGDDSLIMQAAIEKGQVFASVSFAHKLPCLFVCLCLCLCV
jgi:hypothetical protein